MSRRKRSGTLIDELAGAAPAAGRGDADLAQACLVCFPAPASAVDPLAGPPFGFVAV